MVPKILRLPEFLNVSTMVRLILQTLATMTSARKERHEAVHVWCSTRLPWPCVTLPILKFWRTGVACLHRTHGFVRRLPVPILLHSFLERVTAQNPKGFPPTNPFRHQFYAVTMMFKRRQRDNA